MEAIIQSLQPYLHRYGYAAVFVALFLEDFGVPVPGETLLIAGALLATSGQLNIFLLGATAVVAAMLGDNVGYAIGRFGGRLLVLRFGRYIFLTQDRLGYAERFFKKQGAIVVVVARFFEILRQLNGIVSGIAGMPWWRFCAFNAIGAVMWVGFWSTLVYELGRQGRHFGYSFKRYEPYIVAALVVLAAALIGIRIAIHRRRKKRADPQEQSSKAP